MISPEAMARPPAQVRFPGDRNKKQRVRVRGIKQASREIQKRLERNLESLLADPEVILPKINAELGRPWRDPMAFTLRSIDAVSAKRHNKKWLAKKMVKRRGDSVSRALAGSLLAASEEDWTTVSVFKNQLFGNASYLRRGNGKQGHQAAIQNHTNHRLRLLLWDEHAKAGHYFFSWEGGFEYTGTVASPPKRWVEWSLRSSTLELKEEGGEFHSKSLDSDSLTSGQPTENGWLRMAFGDGTRVGIASEDLSQKDSAFIPSIALGMLPPRIPAVSKAEWIWKPQGWPEDQPLPEEGLEEVQLALIEWMSSRIPDGAIAEVCRKGILSSISTGHLSRNIWFSTDDRDGFLNSLEGTELERSALNIILEELKAGIHVKDDGTFEEIEYPVIRVDEASCHPVLVTLWQEYGLTLLADMFGLEGEEALATHMRQTKRKQGFAAFLKELKDNRSIDDRLKLLPWDRDVLPDILSFADGLIRDSFRSGVSSTVSMTSKQRGLQQAMGWAWLVVHNKTESDAWRFDKESRDKGGDWVPYLSTLYEEGMLLLNDQGGSQAAYEEAMRSLASACGVVIS